MIAIDMIKMKRKSALCICMFISLNCMGDQIITLTNGHQQHVLKEVRVEPDGVSYQTKSGVIKIPFTELPEHIRLRHGYDPVSAQNYSTSKAIAQRKYQADIAEKKRVQEQAVKSAELWSFSSINHVNVHESNLQMMRNAMMRETSNGAVQRVGDFVLRPQDTAPYDAARSREKAAHRARIQERLAELNRKIGFNERQQSAYRRQEDEKQKQVEEDYYREQNRQFNVLSDLSLRGVPTYRFNTGPSVYPLSQGDVNQLKTDNNKLEAIQHQIRGF